MNLNLTRLSLLALICLLSVSSAMAVPANCGISISGGPVQPNQYPAINGGNNGYVCDIGQLQFSNFVFTSNQVTSMVVSPITTPGLEGFDFSAFSLHTTANNTSEDLTVKFTVTALTGLLTDVHIDLGAPDFSGTGDVHYSESICSSTGCQLFVDDPATISLSTDVLLKNTPVGNTTTLNIIKDLSVNAGSNGSASVSDFDNYYSHTVPEPKAVSIVLGLGMLGVVAFLKRRQAVRS